MAQGEKLIVERIESAGRDESEALWRARQPEQRRAALREWVATLPKGAETSIPDDALRRENLYD
jgi:hypothetical protein